MNHDDVVRRGPGLATHIAETAPVQESVQGTVSRPVEDVAIQQIRDSVQVAQDFAKTTAVATKDFGESTARAAKSAVTNISDRTTLESGGLKRIEDMVMPMIPNSSWTADDWFGFTFALLACAALAWTGWNVYKMSPPEDRCMCKGRCKCKDSSSDPDENIEMQISSSVQ